MTGSAMNPESRATLLESGFALARAPE